MSDRHTERAKALLFEHLEKHPDPAVRAVNSVVELADDHPSVVAIADALRVKEMRQ